MAYKLTPADRRVRTALLRAQRDSAYRRQMEKEEVQQYFHEFGEFAAECRFADCVHIGEADCAVKQALAEGKISNIRYENYRQMYQELQNKKKY